MRCEKEKIEAERVFYVHSKLLNNVLLGSPHDWIDQQRALSDVEFECDLEHCSLILTGICRDWYLRCGETDSSYFEGEYEIKNDIRLLAARLGFRYHLLYHNVTKEICILASAQTKEAQRRFYSFVEGVHRIVSDTLGRTMPGLAGRCANATAFCGPVLCYEDIASHFSAIAALKAGSFFDMRDQIVTPALRQKQLRAIHSAELSSLVDEMNDSVLSADYSRAVPALKSIVLDKLKYGFDFRMVRDTTIRLHTIVQSWALRYGFDIPSSIFEAADADSVCSIEELYLALEHLVQVAVRQIAVRERPIPLIIRETLRFIRMEYKGDLSLDRVSRAIHVSPEHLSRTFKSAMHQGYQDYIRSYRLKLAAERLAADNMPVHAVARDVGITDESHFYRMFRQAYGMPPGIWRDRHRLNGS